MKFGSLFSGIGGMDLGLEWAGFQTKWQVENNDYCLKVLSKRWPNVLKYTDITTLDFTTVEPVDLLAGGFPCQDLSVAGKRQGLKAGTRSGLWFEFLRGIRTLRPRFVLVENVPGLLTNHALGRVLGDLAECGYNAEWTVLSAAQFGAPHLRRRVWIVAYPQCFLGDRTIFPKNGAKVGKNARGKWGQNWVKPELVADPTSLVENREWWNVCEPPLMRVTNGDTTILDRIKGLGNACVPQVVEWIGRQIIESSQ